jgi:hypothetical protein
LIFFSILVWVIGYEDATAVQDKSLDINIERWIDLLKYAFNFGRCSWIHVKESHFRNQVRFIISRGWSILLQVVFVATREERTDTRISS